MEGPENIYCPEITDRKSERTFEIVGGRGAIMVPDLMSDEPEPLIILALFGRSHHSMQ
jgi:hypothetical protein